MAAPKVYKWTDPGAPQFQYNSVPQLQAVFQAVLIDGYGSKTPPGDGMNPWSIPFSDTGSFILKQGGTQARKCCLKLYGMYSTTSATYGSHMKVEKADDYTDLNTPVGLWESASTYHMVQIGKSNSAGRNIPWVIFATERTIVCLFGSNTTGTDTELFDTYRWNGCSQDSWMFGDYVSVDPTSTLNQMCAHAYMTSTSYYDYLCGTLNNNGYSSFGEPRVVLRGSPSGELGAYIAKYMGTRRFDGSMYQYSSGAPTNNTSPYTHHLPGFPNKIDGGLYLEPARFYAEDTIMGSLPGVLYPICRLPFPNNGVIPTIPGAGAYSGSNIYFFTSRVDDSASDYYKGQYAVHDGEWGVD